MLEGLERYMPEGVHWTVPDGGFFLWVTLPEGFDTDAMLPAAADRGASTSRVPGSTPIAPGPARCASISPRNRKSHR